MYNIFIASEINITILVNGVDRETDRKADRKINS